MEEYLDMEKFEFSVPAEKLKSIRTIVLILLVMEFSTFLIRLYHFIKELERKCRKICHFFR